MLYVGIMKIFFFPTFGQNKQTFNGTNSFFNPFLVLSHNDINIPKIKKIIYCNFFFLFLTTLSVQNFGYFLGKEYTCSLICIFYN